MNTHLLKKSSFSLFYYNKSKKQLNNLENVKVKMTKLEDDIENLKITRVP